MRKIFAIGLVLCMLLGMMATGAVAENVDTLRYAEVATEKGTLNMRKAPKDNAEIVTKLPRGTIVQVLQEEGDWTQVQHKNRTGYVMSSFLKEYTEFPYERITADSSGESILAFKRVLHGLGYLKADDINQRFDKAMVNALVKLQLMNNISLDTEAVSPEMQALIGWDRVVKGKSGYLNITTDPDSGLTAAIYCWDTAGTLYDADKSVKVQITYGAQGSGGVPPYEVTVRKSVAAGGPDYADIVKNPFSHIWNASTDAIYLYATVVDAEGNTVTAHTPFRYVLPSAYQ